MVCLRLITASYCHTESLGAGLFIVTLSASEESPSGARMEMLRFAQHDTRHWTYDFEKALSLCAGRLTVGFCGAIFGVNQDGKKYRLTGSLNGKPRFIR